MENHWKSAFDRWEKSATALFESALKSPLLLEPLGAALTAVSSALALRQRVLARGWRMLGLASRQDQERTLHQLNQLQSRLLDLEEKLR